MDALIFEGSLSLSLYIALAFLLAGMIKGILGMGLPAILMAMLTFAMSPIAAISLIVLTMIAANAVQFYRGPAPIMAVRRYWVFGLSIVLSIAVTAYHIKAIPESLLLTAVGIAMVMFAIPSLIGWRYQVGENRLWQVVVGVVAGVLGGTSGVWAPPIVMYLMARNLEKDDFIGVTGFLFFAGSLTLAITLGAVDLLTAQILLPSMAGMAIALCGFWIGERVRSRINRALFRKMLLWAFLVLGLRLLIVSLS